jgi:peptidoglycan/xylan/chitin deacetylase (PgdA/CDA1 family)
MWQGKNKALTFSFDDGVKQDARAIEILNRYHLKATFNLNSGYLGLNGQLNINGKIVQHNKVLASDVKRLYAEHEVAVHTLTHPNLTELAAETITRQVEEDRKALEQLCGYPIRGMAYPCGGVNNDDRVADVIAKNTPIRYARTITSSHSFDLQRNLYRFQPTVYYIEGCLFDIAEKFLREPSDKPKLLYIWGHTYEMDAGLGIDWEKFEELCRLLSGKEDIFYGTNSQVLL